MTGTMAHLVMPAAVFLGLHFLVAGTGLRTAIVGVLGARIYLGLFAALSLASFVWLILAYRDAPVAPVWYLPQLAWVALVFMPFALLGALAAYTTGPALAGAASEGEARAVGIFAVTRHPFLWSVALWAGTHLLVRGDVASLIFFGSFLALGLIGALRADAKKRAGDAEAWRRLAAATSNAPFAAIAGGRARLSLVELGWWRLAVAAALYAGLLLAHGRVFGTAILT